MPNLNHKIFFYKISLYQIYPYSLDDLNPFWLLFLSYEEPWTKLHLLSDANFNFIELVVLIKDFNSKILGSVGKSFKQKECLVNEINRLETNLNEILELSFDEKSKASLQINDSVFQTIVAWTFNERNTFYSRGIIGSKKEVFDSFSQEMRKLEKGSKFLNSMLPFITQKRAFSFDQMDFLSSHIDVATQNISAACKCLTQESMDLLQITKSIPTFNILFSQELKRFVKAPVVLQNPYFLEPEYKIPEIENLCLEVSCPLVKETSETLPSWAERIFIKQIKTEVFSKREISAHKQNVGKIIECDYELFVNRKNEWRLEEIDEQTRTQPIQTLGTLTTLTQRMVFYGLKKS